MTDQRMTASGGFIAPEWITGAVAGPVRVTYRVRWWWRRWWLRRHGWSTEWTVEYDHPPVREFLPHFNMVSRRR